MRRHDAPLRAAAAPTRNNRPLPTRADARRRAHETRVIERSVRDAREAFRALQNRAARLNGYGP